MKDTFGRTTLDLARTYYHMGKIIAYIEKITNYCNNKRILGPLQNLKNMQKDEVQNKRKDLLTKCSNLRENENIVKGLLLDELNAYVILQ